MTDIEVKQLIERLRQRSNSNYMLMSHPPKPAPDADCHMAADLLQEALAFKQEVSDVVEGYLDGPPIERHLIIDTLRSLIIPKPKPKPKPDPLVEVMKKAGWADAVIDSCAPSLSAALDALGFEIREKDT